MPVTSWPASAARAAATAESTPPDMAARTFIRDRAAARARSTAGPMASTTASTSAWVEVWPSEKRSECRAPSSSQPIASSTCEGWGTPAEQAEPVEHSMPRASSSISSESPSQPGKPRWALPGSRIGGSSVAVQVRVGHHLDDPADQVVAQGGRPARRTRAAALTASSTAAAKPAIAGVSMVPLRMSRSWPPPCSSGVTRQLAAHDERTDAVGAAELVPGEGERVDAARGEVDRHRADRLDGVGVHRDAVLGGDRDDLVDRLQRADLVVGPHHRDQRPPTRGRARRPRAARRRRAGRRGRPAAARPRRPRSAASQSQRVEHGVVLDRRWPGSGYAAGRRRGATRRCP